MWSICCKEASFMRSKQNASCTGPLHHLAGAHEDGCSGKWGNTLCMCLPNIRPEELGFTITTEGCNWIYTSSMDVDWSRIRCRLCQNEAVIIYNPSYNCHLRLRQRGPSLLPPSSSLTMSVCCILQETNKVRDSSYLWQLADAEIHSPGPGAWLSKRGPNCATFASIGSMKWELLPYNIILHHYTNWSMKTNEMMLPCIPVTWLGERVMHEKEGRKCHETCIGSSF